MGKNITNKLLSILLCTTMLFSSVAYPKVVSAEDEINLEEQNTQEVENTTDTDVEQEQEVVLQQEQEEVLVEEEQVVEQQSEEGSTQEIVEDDISVNQENDLYEITLYGEDKDNLDEVSEAVSEIETSLTSANAKMMMAPLFNALGANNEEGVEEDYPFPRRLDGSDIEHISIHWITEDTEDNYDDAHLYLIPQGDSPFSVRFQIDYALSGEHHYEPGDITIRIPAQIFHKRNNDETKEKDEGKYIGGMIIPLAESPLTTTDFNWSLVDGEYVLTNTRSIIAATKGFIQFEINNLIPHSIIDMDLTDNLQATIEVITHLGNTIGLKSNKIFAQINTTHEVVRANKNNQPGSPRIVEASEVQGVPSWLSKKYPNETHYLIVDWYTNSYHTGNQPFVLTGYDTRTDVATGETSETLHDGFVINGDTNDTKDLGVVFKGWQSSGTSKYSSISVAYPLSQFERDTDYVFTNHVDYELTPIDEVDDKTYAYADGRVVWNYSDPVWIEPTGHFNVFKWGNDNDPGKRSDGEWTTHLDKITRDDIPTPGLQHLNGYYGLYNKALNELKDGEDVNIAYTIKSEGYLLPWTYEGDTRVEENYGKRPVTMVTEDIELWRGTQSNQLKKFVVGEDFDFVSLDFVKPSIGKIKAINVNPDGSFVALFAEDGTFEYQPDNDVTKIPPIILEVLLDGKWVEYASTDWTSGQCVITLKNGTVINGTKLDFPKGTENFRTKVTSGNAYIYYYVRPEIKVYPTSDMQSYIDTLFEDNPTPQAQIWNSVNMTAYDYDGNEIVYLEKNGYDRMNGYTADIAVIPYKNGTVTDINYNKKKVYLHYDAKVEERSVISDIEVYENAVADGLIQEETGGIWWDLLPFGVVPDRDSVKLRKGDRIKDVYTIPNYKNTGRVMLVVEAELTPDLKTYESEDGIKYLEDVPSISFDATCDISYIIEYGDISETDKLFAADLHNVIAFESNNDNLGTIEGYKGEHNDARGTNNVRTPEACINEEELDAMTGLHNNRDSNSFLYAGVNNHVTILNAASTSLIKEVSVNNDHWWSQGTYYGHREENARDVFEGGNYAYRIFMMSNAYTQTRDMILYDSLENYVAIQGNDQEDIEAQAAGKIWRGYLRSVDVSNLTSLGVNAVVYYSTVPKLKLQDVDDALGGHKHPTNTDITNSDIWVKADDYTGSLDDVHAIAIDARYMQDGSEFILEPEQVVTAYINMKAPQGEEADQYIQADAHAYNNIYLDCISVDSRTGGEGKKLFIRQDYVKVGLVENHLTVKKVWDDEDDRDGLRPDSITLTLYRDNEPYLNNPYVENPVTVEMDEEGKIEYTFKYLPYCDDDGNVFHYSVVEKPIDGYRTYFTRPETGHEITITNKHNAELVDISGTKTWVDDSEDVRPSTIKVNLYADGVEVDSQNVQADASGTWNYTFKDLKKYRDQGIEIIYTVDEEVIEKGSLDSYIKEINGYDIVNTYYPYGDVRLTKTVENPVTSIQGKEYTFNIQLHDKQGNPVFDSLDYDVVNSRGRVIGRGKISTGEDIILKDGQSAVIKKVPTSAILEAKEIVPDGFRVKGLEQKGTNITAEGPNEITFTNVYETNGYINLRVKKSLLNSELKNYQFRFALTDENGNILHNASNRIDGTVTFGAIYYDAKDDGKTFTYYIEEIDQGKPGYTYDDSKYKVLVKVKDIGNGTMSATPTYYLDDQKLDDIPEFKNVYEAEGDLSLKVWKQLKGRDLKDKEFTFEILDQEDKVVTTAQNDANGNIVFEEIHFDQDDIGNKYTYKVREKAGEDNKIIYSEELYTITVTVVDNGDGTLSFNQQVQDSSGQIATPSFTNELKPGKLEIEKIVEDKTQGEFKFKVKLTGENIPEDGTYEYTKEQITENGNTGSVNNIFDNLLSVLSPRKIYAEEGDIASGEYEGVDYRITAEGELIIGKEGTTQNLLYNSSRSYSDYPWYEYRNQITSVRFAGTVKANGSIASMFYSCKASSIDLSGLDTSSVTDLGQMFWYCSNLTSLNLSNFDTSNVTSMYYMFGGCSKLTSLDLSNFNTSNLTGMGHMFQDCTKLVYINLSSFDTSNVTSMAYTFSGDNNLRKIDLPDTFSFVTGTEWTKPYYILPESQMKWVREDKAYGPFSPSELENNYTSEMAGTWILYCPIAVFDSSDNSLHLYNADTALTYTPSETQQVYPIIFGWMSSTAWDTEGTGLVFDFDNIPDEVKSIIESVVAEDEKIIDSSVYTKEFAFDETFKNFTALKSIDLKKIDFSKVTYFEDTFYGCKSLEEIDLSYAVTTVDSFSSVFGGCNESLKKIDISGITMSGFGDRGANLGFGSDNVLEEATFGPGMKFADYSYITALPKITHISSTGKWKKKNLEMNGLTPEEFRTQYNNDPEDMAGTWVWEEKEFDIYYFLNKDDNPLELIKTDRGVKYNNLVNYVIEGNITEKPYFIGWNPTMYNFNSQTLDLRDKSQSSGGYKFEYKHYDKTHDASKLVNDNSTGLVKAYVTEMPEGATDQSAIDFLFKYVNSSNNIAFYGVYNEEYEIKYEPGEGATGSMQQDKVVVNENYTIKDSQFYYFNHHQTGWIGSDGNTYELNDTIPADTFKGGDVLTLTAKWEADDNSVQMKDGEFELTLNSNERAIFDNIPAGTAYQVWEETPSGWVLVQSVNTTGEIEPLQTSTASFTNEYNPNATSAQLTAKKTLDGSNASENEFEFQLLNSDNQVIQTKKNSAGGGITFDIITYKREGTYEYTIKEVRGNNSNIQYDEKIIKATVEVSKDDENLVANVTYDPEEALFENKTEPGSLTITKTVEGTEATDKEFTFTVTFSKDGTYNYSGSKQGTISSGGTISLKADETIRIEGLPNDCTYTVEETDIPAGYTLTTSTGIEGKIKSKETAEASFTNTYSATGSINLEANKILKNGTLHNGQFTFVLLNENRDPIGVSTNNASGKVVFDLIEYDQPGTYKYMIAESEGSDENIIYDDNIQEVVVTVTDLGNGQLEAVADYGDKAPEFVNEMKGKDLVIKKFVKNATDAAADKEFVFTLILNDAEGNPITEQHDYTTSKGKSGKISSNSTLNLTADEEVTITNLPIGSTYEIVEGTTNGFALTSKDNETGEILITGANAEFTNTYSSFGEISFEINKILQGRKLADKQFMFVLMDKNDKVISYAQNDADGLVKFPAIGFTEADHKKSYEYKISEVNPEDPGYTYSDEVINVKVDVNDTGNGTITFNVTYDNEAKTLVNKYDSYGEIELKAHKDLVGRKLEEGLFEFELLDAEGEVVSKGTNDANGDIVFEKLAFTEEDADKSYTYTIKEVNDEKPGYTYDDHEETVIVKIEDPGYGILNITAEYDEDEAVFENNYEAEGECVVEANKVLLGRELEDKQFTFELKDSNGEVIETVSNDAKGKITFSSIKYDQNDIDKTYTYAISEVIPETKAPGYTYPSKDMTVDVTVIDNGDGTLSFKVVYSEEGKITNVYQAKGELILKAKKTIVGKALVDNEFTFNVIDESGNVKSVGKNKETGEIVFEPIKFSEKDHDKTYTYSIVEVDDGNPGYTYDKHKEEVVIIINDNGDGTLTIKETYKGKATFENKFTPPARRIPQTGD